MILLTIYGRVIPDRSAGLPMAIPEKLVRLRDFQRQAGWWVVLLYVLSRVVERLRLPMRVRCYYLMAQPVAARARLSDRRRRPFTARFLEPSDIALAQMPLTAETVAFRFDQGGSCLALFKGADLAAYLWLTLDDFDEDEVRVRFAPRPAEVTAWDFDVYVMPDHRASFAFSALWDAADAYLRGQGRQWTVSRISAFNLGSVTSHRRLGARTVGRADFLGLGPVQLMLSNRPPYCRLVWHAAQRPVLPIAVEPMPEQPVFNTPLA